MAVRLTQKDKDKLKRINNSVRRKNKQMDNYGIDIYMPVLTTDKVTSRKQLNDYYDRARTYTRGYAYKYKQNQYGVVASYKELARAKRLAGEVSRERARRFREFAPEEFKSRGKGTGGSIMQRKLMGDSKYDMFNPVKFNFKSLRNREHFENRIQNYMNQLEPDYIDRRNETLKENIINAIEESWGTKGQKAKEYIKSLSPEDVFKEFMTEDVFDFRYIYDKNQVDRQVEIFESTYNL